MQAHAENCCPQAAFLSRRPLSRCRCCKRLTRNILAKWRWYYFDAHTDTYANGCEFDHGTISIPRRKKRLTIRIIRCDAVFALSFDKINGHAGCPPVNDGRDDILAQVKQIVGDMPVYLTFDIDCLDPAFLRPHRYAVVTVV
ncbi:arginase family protein [Salmonella enterica subsp. enterica]|nr:arginase family protein [Salmonella enterica subsp. enterica]